MGERLADWTVFAFALALACCFLIFPFLAIFRRTRSVAGYGYVVCSFVFGANLWILCFLTVLESWGLGAALVGAFVMGIGVFPMALAALAWTSQWALAVEAIIIGALAYGVRLFGLWLVTKA